MGPKEQRDLRENIPPLALQSHVPELVRKALFDETVFRTIVEVVFKLCHGSENPHAVAEEIKRRLELATRD